MYISSAPNQLGWRSSLQHPRTPYDLVILKIRHLCVFRGFEADDDALYRVNFIFKIIHDIIHTEIESGKGAPGTALWIRVLFFFNFMLTKWLSHANFAS